MMSKGEGTSYTMEACASIKISKFTVLYVKSMKLC